MSKSTERPAAKDVSPASPLKVVPPAACGPDGPEATLEEQQGKQALGAVTEGPDPGEDPTAALKRGLEDTRLPADLKAQILAELPSPEEREPLFRELQEKGGLSSEEYFASLGLENEPQP